MNFKLIRKVELVRNLGDILFQLGRLASIQKLLALAQSINLISMCQNMTISLCQIIAVS